ncbi:hypothetical protein MSAN_02286800 [Mycena sanguinolenta]|uniref:Uncharacterized protein n=1 Tax=Mycena sanguinolenta TaxID=230812 RepID=A0A8H6X9H5_9AGAR|nr:hypothetical protein MSAN_02286800 [Mycena sanguinolenta]
MPPLLSSIASLFPSSHLPPPVYPSPRGHFISSLSLCSPPLLSDPLSLDRCTQRISLPCLDLLFSALCSVGPDSRTLGSLVVLPSYSRQTISFVFLFWTTYMPTALSSTDLVASVTAIRFPLPSPHIFSRYLYLSRITLSFSVPQCFLPPRSRPSASWHRVDLVV